MLSLESNGIVMYVINKLLRINFIYCLIVKGIIVFAQNIISQFIMYHKHVGNKFQYNNLSSKMNLSL